MSPAFAGAPFKTTMVSPGMRPASTIESPRTSCAVLKSTQAEKKAPPERG
jgi:hypothetical protein